MRKPNPAPVVPGKTEAERMDNALRRVLSVPKAEFLKEEEARHKREKRRRKAS